MTEYDLYKKEEIAKFINKLDIPFTGRFTHDYCVKLGKDGCYWLVEKLREAGYIK